MHKFKAEPNTAAAAICVIILGEMMQQNVSIDLIASNYSRAVFLFHINTNTFPKIAIKLQIFWEKNKFKLYFVLSLE